MYKIYKLRRKADAENKGPTIAIDGFQFNVEELSIMKLESNYTIPRSKKLENIQDLVGNMAVFQGRSLHNWLRTSIVRKVTETDGDIEIETMNSVYLAKKVDNN